MCIKGETDEMENAERTSIDVADDDLGTFIGKQAGTFCPDALPAAGDDGCLAGEEALRVVEVA